MVDDVWSDLVGQDRVVEILKRAVAGESNAMTHGWLFTGPPGSGRSVAAKAFAAALQCTQGGCNVCLSCRSVMNGSHPDVQLVNTERLTIGVDEVRDLARRAAMSPTIGRWQIIIIEDADRITERGADALLKSLEEPPARTIWMLCAPNAEDLIITIRSRLRRVQLVTTPDEQVAQLLGKDGIEPELAKLAARTAQGHIGRARAFARHPELLEARRSVLRIPMSLTSVEACLTIAQDLILQTTEQAKAATTEIEEAERADLLLALGGKASRGDGALKELEDQQKLRVKRMQRDALDQVLTDLASWYRDVLSVQLGVYSRGMTSQENGVDQPSPRPESDLSDASLSTHSSNQETHFINADLEEEIIQAATHSTSNQTMARIDALLAAREALERNVTPLLAMEALLLELAHPGA